MKTLPSHLKKSLVPLLLSLAVSQAYGVEVVLSGAGGLAGLAGTAPGQHGTDGGAATPLSSALNQAPTDLLRLTLYGGAGGDGGLGGVRGEQIFAGNGGNGGAGGSASGSVTASTAAALDTVVEALVFGGHGGAAGAAGGLAEIFETGTLHEPYDPAFGAGGIGGSGGAAISTASAVVGGAGNVAVKAVAVGGNGGAAAGQMGGGGAAGGASATAYGQSGSGKVSVTAEAYGGNGGEGSPYLRAIGAAGAGVEQVNAVAGRTRGELVLIQQAVAGKAGASGSVDFDGSTPIGEVASANARSLLTLSDDMASSLTAVVLAVGGNGGEYWGYAYPGGTGAASLTLASTRAGTVVDGAVSAVGGVGSYFNASGTGGLADAVAELTGLADVRGSASAYGGAASDTNFGGSGGEARARLVISAGGLATGSANASGGSISGNGYYRPARGWADASVELVGAGARGSAAAEGSGGHSRINARSSGAQAVDVTATARATDYGDASASVYVESGISGSAAGEAGVTARAYAASNDSISSAPASATIDVSASGDIDGVSTALSGDAPFGGYGSPPSVGTVFSSARGISGGDHAVTLRAVARAGSVAFGEIIWITSAAATATAYGQSGAGKVDVSAEARASGGARVFAFDSYGQATASATAINLTRGGRGTARATAWGGDARALASAAGVGAAGAPVRVTGTGGALISGNSQAELQLSVTGKAYGANYYDAAAFQLAGHGGAGQVVVSNVSAGPEQVGAIAGLGPVVAGRLASVAGVGMHAFSSDTAVADVDPWNPMPLRLSASGEFAFDGVSGQHLLIGFVSASFMNGFDSLELSISNNGVDLFSRLFTSADDALLFFSDQVLDLGLFGAGAQDVRVSSIYSYYQPGAFAFNYVVGSGAGVAPVPEASSWLMLVLGLGTLVMVARRRRGAPAGRA